MKVNQEYTVSVKGDMMFHHVDPKDGEVLRLDVYHTGLKKVATVGFIKNEESGEVTCVIRNPRRKIISEMKDKTFERSKNADFELVWESDINLIADEIRCKLKLK